MTRHTAEALIRRADQNRERSAAGRPLTKTDIEETQALYELAEAEEWREGRRG